MVSDDCEISARASRDVRRFLGEICRQSGQCRGGMKEYVLQGE